MVIPKTANANNVFSSNTEITYIPIEEVKTYSELINLDIDDALYLLGDPVMKWGGELGTAPTLSYSFNPGGPLVLDTDYSQDFDTWLGTGAAQNFEDISSTNSDLHVLDFLPTEQKIVEDALQNWSSVTGINFVENDLNTSPYGDLHFTKLDFDAFYDATGYDDFLAGGLAFLAIQRLSSRVMSFCDLIRVNISISQLYLTK